MRKFILRLTGYMAVLAGAVLIFMALLTLADIILRFFGRPIPGVYEVVAFLGLALAGLVLPRSSLMKAHVSVDMVTEKLSPNARMIVNIFTRALVALFFLVTGWYFIGMGRSFIETNSVTMTLKIPFYPVVFVMVFSFFVQTLVTIFQMSEKKGENKDE